MNLNNPQAPAFVPLTEFSCRVCGGEYVPAAEKFNLCAACFSEFDYYRRGGGPARGKKQGKTLNSWLARRLLLDIMRLKRNGTTGRCEALGRGSQGWRDGSNLMQCRSRAITMRDGRRVCEKHATATRCIWFGSNLHDAYSNFELVMIELAKADARFRECLARALRDSAARCDDDRTPASTQTAPPETNLADSQ